MRFIEYVIADKIRAQSYKSTRGEA